MKARSVSADCSDRRLVHVNKAIVLGVEDRVNGRERDVLVAAPVAGDEMRIEHFVVVGVCVMPSSVTPGSRIRSLERVCISDDVVTIGVPHAPAPHGARCR